MPQSCSFRQVEEKHVSAEVELMVWSPRMDLLAIANVQGEAVLHRLSWQKVWTLPPPGEEVKITSLVWRPDGKVLAVSYSTGKLLLCDVENASLLHTNHMSSVVTSMAWVSETQQDTDKDNVQDCFVEESQQFLPKLPNFPKSYAALGKGQSEENVEDAKRLRGQTDLNILVVGMAGVLHMYAYGLFPVGVVHLSDHQEPVQSGQVLSGHLSQDLRLLSLLVLMKPEEGNQQYISYLSFDTTLLASRHRELRILALKFGQVLTHMMYLDSTIQQMSEAWEDILLEMDSKLMKFAEEKHKIEGGTVSNDFLRLLMFGTPSEELQAFLLHELTDKGLKKLGHSIETSYSNIQKLVLKHLQSVGQAIVYHLTDIRGMSLWYDKFGVLGLSTKEVHDAISTAGSFMLKASELQQVIDGSMKNFKAFFRWLYVVIKGLSDEQVPPELTKMTQQDLNFVAQFLKENFTEESDSSKSGFKLEKVGQYLKNEDLTDPPDNDSNLWVNFLQQTSTLNDDGLLYPAQPEKSLIQMHKQLKASVDTALNKCATVIGQSLQCVHSYRLANISSDNEKLKPKVSQMSKTTDDESSIYTLLTTNELPCKKCHLLRQNTTGERSLEICSLEFHEIGSRDPDDSTNSERVGRHLVQDLSFYDSETVSALLLEDCEDGMPVLVQVPLAAIGPDEYCQVELLSQPLTDSTEICCVDAGSHVDNLNYRRLENMKASQFAVSGTRRVACVLFSSRRRVRLFLMDVEDEEDDDDDEDEDEEADSSLQQQQQGDVSRGEQDESREDEGDEDKENSRESAMDV